VENVQNRIAETPPVQRNWATIAQAPKPAKASATARAEPTPFDAIARTSRLRHSIDRVSRAICVEESVLIVKFSEMTAKSGATSGCEKNAATASAEGTPTTVHSTPRARLVQKTVDRSSSLISRRWISAEPSDGSAKIVANPVKTSAMPARPYSWGVSRCASRTPKITRVPTVATCATSFQPTPRTTELRRPSAGPVVRALRSADIRSERDPATVAPPRPSWRAAYSPIG
jgi:hypothetical protein